MSKTRPTKTRIRPEPPARPAEPEDGFRPWHFFVLVSLVAATSGVVLARGTSAANLVLISLAIGAAGTAAMGLYRTLAPLAGDEIGPPAGPLGERARGRLEREKMLALRTIKELEFDRAMGKISVQDFDEMVARLRARAIALMKQLDLGTPGYRELIERELLLRLGAPPAPRGRESLPTEAAEPAEAGGAEKGARHLFSCVACGTTNDPDARFCKQCGARLGGGDSS